MSRSKIQRFTDRDIEYLIIILKDKSIARTLLTETSPYPSNEAYKFIAWRMEVLQCSVIDVHSIQQKVESLRKTHYEVLEYITGERRPEEIETLIRLHPWIPEFHDIFGLAEIEIITKPVQLRTMHETQEDCCKMTRSYHIYSKDTFGMYRKKPSSAAMQLPLISWMPFPPPSTSWMPSPSSAAIPLPSPSTSSIPSPSSAAIPLPSTSSMPSPSSAAIPLPSPSTSSMPSSSSAAIPLPPPSTSPMRLTSQAEGYGEIAEICSLKIEAEKLKLVIYNERKIAHDYIMKGHKLLDETNKKTLLLRDVVNKLNSKGIIIEDEPNNETPPCYTAVVETPPYNPNVYKPLPQLGIMDRFPRNQQAIRNEFPNQSHYFRPVGTESLNSGSSAEIIAEVSSEEYVRTVGPRIPHTSQNIDLSMQSHSEYSVPTEMLLTNVNHDRFERTRDSTYDNLSAIQTPRSRLNPNRNPSATQTSRSRLNPNRNPSATQTSHSRLNLNRNPSATQTSHSRLNLNRNPSATQTSRSRLNPNRNPSATQTSHSRLNLNRNPSATQTSRPRLNLNQLNGAWPGSAFGTPTGPEGSP